MFRDIGLNDWLFDINNISADTLNTTLMQIQQNYPVAKENVRKAMQVVAERQKASMQVVRKLVKLTS